MKRYWGTQKVQPGIYLNLRHLSFKSMDQEGDLPGTDQDQYRRMPTIVPLIIGPVLGGLYVVFLPLIGFAILLWFAGSKALELAAHAAAASVRVLRPAWRPAKAFFSRNTPARDKNERRDTWAEDVKKDLETGKDNAA